MKELNLYADLLGDIKARIRQAQTKASLSVNAEMILMYSDIGRMIHERQQKKGWGAGVIPRLAKDIRNELREVKGFSELNIGYMIRFAREYEKPILQQAVAKLATGSKGPQPVAHFRAPVKHFADAVCAIGRFSSLLIPIPTLSTLQRGFEEAADGVGRGGAAK